MFTTPKITIEAVKENHRPIGDAIYYIITSSIITSLGWT